MQVRLEGNADAVEFCPEARPLVLAAATYTLVEDAQERVGSVSAFQVDGSLGLRLLDRVTSPGVFDIRWRPRNQGECPLLALALSDGDIRLYSFREGEDKLQSSFQDAGKLAASDSMCLSLDWDCFGSCNSQRMVVSHSNGSASTLDVSSKGLVLVQTWQAHDFEVWTAAYNRFTREVVYTGADDSHFCTWDLRLGLDRPVFRDKKSHEMGVCCIQSSPLWDNILATGSYDGNLRIWDCRMMQRPVMKQKLGLGGGVWKVKWHPSNRRLLAAACMHNGFAVIRVNDEESGEVVEEYKEHESLAYGIDWSPDGGCLASCSFYDKAVHVWKLKTGITE